MESLYDHSYDSQDEEELYIYSPSEHYEEVDEDGQQSIDSADTLPHRLEDTVYQTASDSVPFYGDTTSKAAYTWKVPNKKEGRVDFEQASTEKIPFYSETTHRSQYLPIDTKIARTQLLRRASAIPASQPPLATETSYRNLFRELEIGKRQKLVNKCFLRWRKSTALRKRSVSALHRIGANY